MKHDDEATEAIARERDQLIGRIAGVQADALTAMLDGTATLADLRADIITFADMLRAKRGGEDAGAGELVIFETADDGCAPDALLIDGDLVTPLTMTALLIKDHIAAPLTLTPFAAVPHFADALARGLGDSPEAADTGVFAKLAAFPSPSTMRLIDRIAAADAAIRRVELRGSSLAASAFAPPPLSEADAATFERLRRDLAVARERGQLVSPEDLAAYAPALSDSDAAVFEKLRRLGSPR